MLRMALGGHDESSTLACISEDSPPPRSSENGLKPLLCNEGYAKKFAYRREDALSASYAQGEFVPKRRHAHRNPESTHV